MTRGDRLTAQITGKATERTIGPEEAHARNVLAVTKCIHTKARRLMAITKEAKRLRSELKADRRELRHILQRDSRRVIDFEIAGAADAIDAMESRPARVDKPRKISDDEALAEINAALGDKEPKP